MKRRRGAGNDSGDDGEGAGKEENLPIESYVGETGRIGRKTEFEQRQTGCGQGPSQRATSRRNENAFGDKLADDAVAACAEGNAKGNFLAANSDAGKSEVGYIRAGYEKNER